MFMFSKNYSPFLLIYLFTAFSFCLNPVSSFAQSATGKIAGKITDQNTGEDIIGLTVVIEGTTKGVQTNIEGRYSLDNLVPGNYTLVFRYLTYGTKKVENVVVNAGQLTELSVTMAEESRSINEVVVTSTFQRESINALYSIQKNNVSISDGISSDVIKRSPDKSTSDVLKRVSGTSIQDNKFVIIRGLSDRYNVAMLNNSILPSSEPDKRAFSFDIIPSNLIDNIIINKTASPELPGDFAGGVVQVLTRDVPEENFIDFSVGFGLNTQSTFNKFISNGRGKYDYLGFGDGNRNLPEGFPITPKRYNNSNLDDRIKSSKLFENKYAEQSSTALPSQNYQVTFGTKKILKNSAVLGTIASLTYRNSQNISPITRYDYDGESAYFQYDDKQYRFSTNVGALLNLTYIKNNNKISFKNLANKVLDEVYTSRTGYNTNNANNVRFGSNELTQKSLVSSQLLGQHKLNYKDVLLNWNINFANTQRDQPDLRTILFSQPLNLPDTRYTIVDRNSRHFFSSLNENAVGGAFNAQLPFDFLTLKSSFKIGSNLLIRDRRFDARIFNYKSATPNFNNSIIYLPIDQVFSTNNINTEGFVLNEFTNFTDTYTAQSNLLSSFINLDNQLTKKIKLNWGFRLESFNQQLDTRNLSDKAISIKANNFDILPSANLSLALTEKSNIRFSASKTVSRPEFRELAPFSFYDFLTSSSLSGNPVLKQSNNQNYDTRFEYYPSPGEVTSISAFYKRFKNPIEQIANSASGADLRIFSFENAKEANTFGFEFEFRRKLAFINPSTIWLQDFSLFANAAYMISKVDLSNQKSVDRALQGQSPYLINSGLQYANQSKNYAISVLYNRIGQRIFVVGYQGYADYYENSRDVIDIQISKKVISNAGELKINVSDIFNQKAIIYQNGDSKKSYNKNNDRIINISTLGTNVSLSFSYKFGLLKEAKSFTN